MPNNQGGRNGGESEAKDQISWQGWARDGV